MHYTCGEELQKSEYPHQNCSSHCLSTYYVPSFCQKLPSNLSLNFHNRWVSLSLFYTQEDRFRDTGEDTGRVGPVAEQEEAAFWTDSCE